MLTRLEKRIIAGLPNDIGLTSQPYIELAEKLQISEETLLHTLKSLCERGVIRRFGATIRHQISGFEANAMVAWKVDQARVDEVGEKMASFKAVTHCYQRAPRDGWPYNLYTMIHARDEASCREIARKMSAKTSVDTYTLLFSLRELKKTSMNYFPSDDED